jgi:putative transposase
MPQKIISEGEHYHIFNRGIEKKTIFHDDRDRARFLFYVLYFQSPDPIYHAARSVTGFLKEDNFPILASRAEQIIKTRMVELVAFALMPNHFHLLVREVKEGGVSRYLQRIEGGFAKYSQAKYKQTGHFFERSFKAVQIDDNVQLLHLSAYIHKNPQELDSVGRRGIEEYRWSSYQDFTDQNRWSGLLIPNVIRDQFKDPGSYRVFVRESVAKEVMDDELLLD